MNRQIEKSKVLINIVSLLPNRQSRNQGAKTRQTGRQNEQYAATRDQVNGSVAPSARGSSVRGDRDAEQVLPGDGVRRWRRAVPEGASGGTTQRALGEPLLRPNNLSD